MNAYSTIHNWQTARNDHIQLLQELRADYRSSATAMPVGRSLKHRASMLRMTVDGIRGDTRKVYLSYRVTAANALKIAQRYASSAETCDRSNGTHVPCGHQDYLSDLAESARANARLWFDVYMVLLRDE